MERWEYKQIVLGKQSQMNISILNDAGNQGWELVHIVEIDPYVVRAILKRKIA